MGRSQAYSRAMNGALSRLYGQNWDDAPQPLRRAVAVIVAAGLVSLAISVPLAVAASSTVGMAVGFVLFVLVIHLGVIGLAVFLLRRSRVMWLLFVALSVGAATQVPDGVWDVPGYVVNAVTLVLLLVPGAVRAVWTGHENAYATTPDVRRPD